MSNISKWEDNEEIKIFREYLRIPSVHPNIDHAPCIEFLRAQATDLGLPMSVHYPVNEKNPVVVLTWLGAEPNLPSIMLNSHMDVVPVFEEHWSYPPFAADIDDDGNIFARGSQDMKCVGTLYLAAIRALKRDGIKMLKRTIHVTFVPDEETGGKFGMKPFVKTEAFKALNVRIGLDESCAISGDNFLVFYAERTTWLIELICRGRSGHGSSLNNNTPGQKVNYLLNKFMEFREAEAEKVSDLFHLGEVTSVNLTMLSGGVQGNVIPPEFRMTFDVRLANDIDFDQFEQKINQWCEEAGGSVEVIFHQKSQKAAITQTDESNPFYTALKNAFDELNLKYKLLICPGGTDARYLRQQNIPAFGITPINHTPLLLHDHDEHVNAARYLAGIDIYKKVISNLANV